MNLRGSSKKTVPYLRTSEGIYKQTVVMSCNNNITPLSQTQHSTPLGAARVVVAMSGPGLRGRLTASSMPTVDPDEIVQRVLGAPSAREALPDVSPKGL